MYAVGAETRATGIGKCYLPVAARWFAEPGFQYGDGVLGQRDTAFLATLSNHANLGVINAA